MSIHRTKEQKRKAQAKRVETHSDRVAPTFSYTATQSAKRASHMVEGQDIVSGYVKKDLLKTALVSLILFASLVGIYIYLGYN